MVALLRIMVPRGGEWLIRSQKCSSSSWSRRRCKGKHLKYPENGLLSRAPGVQTEVALVEAEGDLDLLHPLAGHLLGEGSRPRAPLQVVWAALGLRYIPPSQVAPAKPIHLGLLGSGCQTWRGPEGASEEKLR